MERRLFGRRAATVAIGVLVVLASVLAVQWWNKRPLANDLTSYLNASRAFWAGENPYLVAAPAPFVYPLFLCVAIWPLAQLPAWLAGILWLAASIGAAGLTIHLLARIHDDDADAHDRIPALLVAAAIVFVFLADVVQNNLVNGQVNFLVLLCCAGFAWHQYRGRTILASTWLAIAIATKLTPAVFLLFLARRFAWKPLALTVGIAAVLLVALPWAVAGTSVLEYYRSYISDFGMGRLTGEAVAGAEQIPFSIAGALRKFAGISSPASATIIGLLVAAVVALVLDPGRARNGRSWALTTCLYLSAALLITPMSEVHHLAWLLPGLTLLTWDALTLGTHASSRAALAGVLIAGLLIREVPGAAILAVAGTCGLLAAALRR